MKQGRFTPIPYPAYRLWEQPFDVSRAREGTLLVPEQLRGDQFTRDSSAVHAARELRSGRRWMYEDCTVTEGDLGDARVQLADRQGAWAMKPPPATGMKISWLALTTPTPAFPS